jgi:hypothetical protein
MIGVFSSVHSTAKQAFDRDVFIYIRQMDSLPPAIRPIFVSGVMPRMINGFFAVFTALAGETGCKQSKRSYPRYRSGEFNQGVIGHQRGVCTD